MTTEADDLRRLNILEKIRLAEILGFTDDVEYWQSQLEELPEGDE